MGIRYIEISLLFNDLLFHKLNHLFVIVNQNKMQIKRYDCVSLGKPDGICAEGLSNINVIIIGTDQY